MKPYFDEGGITIYHADCRDLVDLLPAADLALLDPPYGLGDRMQGGTWGATYKASMTWDAKTMDDLVRDFATRSKAAIVWGGNYYTLPPSRGWLCWYKPGAVRTMASIELAWTSLDKNARHISHAIAATNGERLGHPTQKPLRVIEWSIAYADLPLNSLIVDLSMGTGTSLRAAKNMGHRAIGVELDERWCEVAALRLSQHVMDFGAPV